MIPSLFLHWLSNLPSEFLQTRKAAGTQNVTLCLFKKQVAVIDIIENNENLHPSATQLQSWHPLSNTVLNPKWLLCEWKVVSETNLSTENRCESIVWSCDLLFGVNLCRRGDVEQRCFATICSRCFKIGLNFVEGGGRRLLGVRRSALVAWPSSPTSMSTTH